MKHSHSPNPAASLRRLLVAVSIAGALALQATPAHAAKAPVSEEDGLPDARLFGYPTEVTIDGGTMGTYMLLSLLGVLAVGVTFKNARRSHLD